MSRTTRLFDLIQVLRSHRRAVTAAALAEELGVSKRTVHRDLDTLRELGAPIDGEAGVGYLLRPGFLLPPLMLNEDELEALALGALWVRQRADPALAGAAGSALAKIGAVTPQALTSTLEAPASLTATVFDRAPSRFDPAAMRRAIRERRKVALAYAKAPRRAIDRVVWPVALVYVEDLLMLAAWCELRQAFRHFRADRVERCVVLDEVYPGTRARLARAWHDQDVGDAVRRD
ncbi:MAG: YafY family protein [Luteibacter sp.]